MHSHTSPEGQEWPGRGRRRGGSGRDEHRYRDRGDREHRGREHHPPGPPRRRGGPGGFGGPGFGWPGFGGGRGYGGGRGSGGRAARGDVRLSVLALLAEQPRHGYQIITEITERSGGAWTPSPGSVYPVLQQLQDEGLVRPEEADGRRVFHLTEAGQAYVAEHQAELKAPWESVGHAPRQGIGELFEVFKQVAAAAWQVAQTGSEAQIGQARDVLADTRRSLYRILAEDEPATGPATEEPESPA
ncbi:MAG: PadR family transcriptional regulator [Pseudonocardiales bacterium]|nr:MAG: PadR family transcriptional regulator [Pseudonocardiales bacterium]